MNKMSDKKTERSVPSKVVKTKKEIASKIDTGMAQKPSAISLAKSRQQSAVSRTTSKQSNLSTSISRPGSSATATRTSKVNLVDSKPGMVPAYLRNKRPVTASGKDSEVNRKFGTQSKPVLDGIVKKTPLDKSNQPPAATVTNVEQTPTETDQIDSGMKAGDPPCEGDRPVPVDIQQTSLSVKEQELRDLQGKMKQLEELYDQLDKDCKKKQEQISELEAVLAVKSVVIVDRENDIQKLIETVENLRSTTTSREQEMEQTLAGLRQELVEKCNDLGKAEGKIWHLNERIEDLKEKLVQVGNDLEEKENQLDELLKKENKKDSKIDEQLEEIKVFKHKSEEFTQKINDLTQEIANKDSMITYLLAAKPTNTVQPELEAFLVEATNSRTNGATRQDDILLQVRSKLLNSLESSQESFKARCEVDGDTDSDNRTAEEGLAAKQRHQCSREEQIISDIERNNQKSKAVRNKLLEMLKQLKKENRQMREILRNNYGQDTQPEPCEKSLKNDSRLKGQLLDQIYRLFPEEPLLQKETMEQIVEEEVLNRIDFEKISSKGDATQIR